MLRTWLLESGRGGLLNSGKSMRLQLHLADLYQSATVCFRNAAADQ